MRRFAATIAILLSIGGTVAAAPDDRHGARGVYADPELASDAVRLAAAAKSLAAGRFNGRSADDLTLEGEQSAADPGQALALFGGAVAAGRDDRRIWLDFALAAQRDAAATTDAGRVLRDRDWTETATYRAYEKSGTPADRASTLAALSRLYAAREAWRPALDADRASLALVDDPAVRAAYGPLREEHGFRLDGYKVDADSAAPRICFRFTEDLGGSAADLAPYVTVDGRAGALLSTEDRQLCVEGLAHGARYHVTIRRGLPSTVGEDLLKAAEYDIAVPDRPARIAFAGRGYVLPRLGSEGVPLLSVNVDRVDVSILHVGDRSLVRALRSEDFRGQLAPYAFRHLGEEDARKVWSGTLDIASKLNADVTTAFPVRTIAGALGPGVYVLQARVHGAGGGDDDDFSGGDGRSATQWFVVSDLGLTTLSGGGLVATVRSLSTARPVEGATVRLLARDDEVLDTRTTGPEGTAVFDPGLLRGEGGAAPAAVTAATADGDANFIDLGAAPLDLTDRGDKGRPAGSGLDAFVYAERGVYRSGETVYLTALLRDAAGAALPGLPLTLVVTRPDGVESRRVAVPDGGLGGHAFALSLLAEAATGTWHVTAFADPKGSPVGETTFLVEDYLPERLAVTLLPETERLHPGEAARVAATARFLYGAPGAGLEITGSSTVEAASGPAWPALKGYGTGLADETVESVTTDLPDAVTTGRDGTATVTLPVPAVTATRPLQARIALRVGEPGGRAVERGVTVPILPATPLIGVRQAGAAGDGAPADFDVVTVDRDGNRSGMGNLHWRLSRTLQEYQWYHDGDGGRWRFEPVASTRLTAEGRLATAAGAPARISAPVAWGSYRLDLSADDPAVPPTSLVFYAGYRSDASADSPDLLPVTLDRVDYRPGDILRATVASPFAGRATLVIGGSAVLARHEVALAAGDNRIEVPVEAAWGTGAYAIVLAHRPLDVAAKRMPGRAIGLAWFAVDAAARDLGVKIDLPATARPRGTLHVPLRLTGLPPGEPAAVTVSAVDLGILNLTRYETPHPGPYFFGQRTLGLELRDLYGALIDGLGVAAGAVHQGGDAGFDHAAEKPTQAPLARYSGIVPVGSDGTAAVDFDIPAFEGTVRVAAVAWSKSRAGSAEADVVMRDPVVVATSLPRFLDIGDRARVHVELDDVEGAPGPYRLEVAPRGPWFLPTAALDRTVDLASGARTGVDIPVTAAGLGAAGLSLRLTGPGGLDLSQDVALGVEPGAPAVYRRDVHSLAPGRSLALTPDLLGEFIPGSGSVSVAVSPLGDIDVPALLLALDRYPVGCSEQITSRAMPLLYVDRLAPRADLAVDADLKPRLQTAVAQLLSRETAEGSFGLWSADSGTDDPWLDAYVTDFLTRAREAGYAVPAPALDRALDRLRNAVANGVDDRSSDDKERVLSIGYAAYVLARNGRPVMADLRYLAAERLGAIASPLGKAQVGAALTMLGDRPRAAAVFDAAAAALATEPDERVYREDFGSRLRDAAAVLALASDAGADAAAVKAAAVLVEAQRSPYPRNTQEQAWLVLAAQAVGTRARDIALDVDGQPHAGPLYRQISAMRLDGSPVVLANTGRDPVDVVVTTSGQLPTPEAAASQGYAVERRYYHMDGSAADPSRVAQNERLVAVVAVTEDVATRARLLLTDPLPAGFEIDNPALVEDGAVPNLPGLCENRATHTEFRDDRFTAAFDRSPGDPAGFSVAYVVRAVTPGRFVQPPAVVEDMYRPERFGRSRNGSVEVVPAR